MSAYLLSIASGLIRFISDWMSRAREKMLLALGAKQQESTDLRARIDALEKANQSREKALTDIARGGNDGLLRDDGFKRPDGDE